MHFDKTVLNDTSKTNDFISDGQDCSGDGILKVLNLSILRFNCDIWLFRMLLDTSNTRRA